jgi:hypothetical protein
MAREKGRCDVDEASKKMFLELRVAPDLQHVAPSLVSEPPSLHLRAGDVAGWMGGASPGDACESMGVLWLCLGKLARL